MTVEFTYHLLEAFLKQRSIQNLRSTINHVHIKSTSVILNNKKARVLKN